MGEQVWQELWDTRLDVLLLQALAWGALGAVLGLLLAVAGTALLRRQGAWTWGWRHARWLRWAGYAVVALGGAAAGGAAGGLQGVSRGAEVVLRESQLATRVFPVAGEAGADLLLVLDEAARGGSVATLDSAALSVALEEFRAGRRELDVEGLMERVRDLSDVVVHEAMASVTARVPGLGDHALLQTVVEASLASIARRLLARELGKQAEALHLDAFYREVVDELPALAARAGDPRSASRSELAEHLVQRGLVPALLRPLRGFLRSQQLVAGLAWLGFLFVPPGLFALAEAIRLRREARPASGDPARGAEDPAPGTSPPPAGSGG